MSNYIYENKYINVPGLNYCTILPSGRILCRHPNNEGSVLVFDQYGTQTKLYIPDAKFRDLPYKELMSDPSRQYTQLHSTKLTYNSNRDTAYILGDTLKRGDKPFTETEFSTDAQLQKTLDLKLSSGSFKNDFTAKQGTDALLTLDANSKAVTYARSLVPTGLRACDIPNIYELAVIWLESDNIDSIDPTLNDYSNLRLGSPRRFASNYFWSCSEIHSIINNNNVFENITLYFTGFISPTSRLGTYIILPVLEL